MENGSRVGRASTCYPFFLLTGGRGFLSLYYRLEKKKKSNGVSCFVAFSFFLRDGVRFPSGIGGLWMGLEFRQKGMGGRIAASIYLSGCSYANSSLFHLEGL